MPKTDFFSYENCDTVDVEVLTRCTFFVLHGAVICWKNYADLPKKAARRYADQTFTAMMMAKVGKTIPFGMICSLL